MNHSQARSKVKNVDFTKMLICLVFSANEDQVSKWHQGNAFLKPIEDGKRFLDFPKLVESLFTRANSGKQIIFSTQNPAISDLFNHYLIMMSVSESDINKENCNFHINFDKIKLKDVGVYEITGDGEVYEYLINRWGCNFYFFSDFKEYLSEKRNNLCSVLYDLGY